RYNAHKTLQSCVAGRFAEGLLHVNTLAIHVSPSSSYFPNLSSGGSVAGGSALDMIDHQHVYRTRLCSELKAELFPQGLGQWRRKSDIGVRIVTRVPCQRDFILAGETGSVLDQHRSWAFQNASEPGHRVFREK